MVDTIIVDELAQSRGRPMPWAPGAAALNLTGLGLGYFYLRRWVRGGSYLVITAALVVTAFLTNASSLSWPWQVLAPLWVVLAALDAWRLAWAAPPGRPAPVLAKLLTLGLAVLLIAGGTVAYLAYRDAGQRAFDDGVQAQRNVDCVRAAEQFALVTGVYELALSPNVPAADAKRSECDALNKADGDRAEGRFADAVAGYRAFRSSHPDSALAPALAGRLEGTFQDWGKSLRERGDLDAAVTAYRDGLSELGPTSPVRAELAATYVERATKTRGALPTTEAELLTSVQSVMDDLLVVRNEFGDTPAAGSVGQAMTDTMNALHPPFAAVGHCGAVPVLDHLAGLPADKIAEISTPVADNRLIALSECGLQKFRESSFSEAKDMFAAVEGGYPQSPQAAQARSARIAAEVAIAKAGPPIALPEPFTTDTPGAIEVVYFNVTDQPVQVLVAGTTAHQFDLPACVGCPPYEAGACDTASGKPSFTLRLRPGSYDVLSRPQPGIGSLTFNQGFSTDVLEPGYTYTNCTYLTNN